MSADNPGRARRRSVLPLVAALGFLVLVTTALVSAFQVGLGLGLMSAGSVLIVYQIPAIVFDWPRLTLEHILDFFGFLWNLISSLWE